MSKVRQAARDHLSKTHPEYGNWDSSMIEAATDDPTADMDGMRDAEQSQAGSATDYHLKEAERFLSQARKDKRKERRAAAAYAVIASALTLAAWFLSGQSPALVLIVSCTAAVLAVIAVFYALMSHAAHRCEQDYARLVQRMTGEE